jgi:hypothetical protein
VCDREREESKTQMIVDSVDLPSVVDLETSVGGSNRLSGRAWASRAFLVRPIVGGEYVSRHPPRPG